MKTLEKHETKEHDISKVNINREPTSEQIALAHLPIVKKVVNKLARNLPAHIDIEELYSVGTVGLMAAVEKFTSSQSETFAGYVALRVRGAVLDELRKRDTLPRSSRAKARKLYETECALEQKLGRQPSETEIRHALGLKGNEYLQMQRQTQNVRLISLDSAPTNDEDNAGTLHDAIADDNVIPCAQLMEQSELKEQLIEHINQLPERQRKILALYYFEGMHLAEIAEIYQVTEARICQIHTQCIATLRHRMTNCA